MHQSDIRPEQDVGFILNMPKPSGWECQLFGIQDGIVIRPNEGNVPWFWWRWMQYLLLGNRWRKVD